MAQLLEDFEQRCEKWVPAEEAEAFKREARRKINGLANDAVAAIELGEDAELNGVAIQVRDRLGATST